MMTRGYYSESPHVETATDRIASLKTRMERLKIILGEIEGDIEKIEAKSWLDYKTLKRLDKAIVVMKVGYKIGKRGLNRDKKYGNPAAINDPDITESDQQSVMEIATEMRLDVES